MSTIDAEKRKATREAKAKGHSMTRYEKTEKGSRSECKTCGLDILVQEWRNGLAVVGTATVYTCETTGEKS